MKYLTKPAGIIKAVTIVFGIIVLGCCIGGRPGDSLKAAEESSNEVELWKTDFYLSIVVIALVVSIASLAFFTLQEKGAEKLRLVDVGISAFLGLMVLISASLLLAETVELYDDAKTLCEITGLGANNEALNLRSITDELNDATASCVSSDSPCTCVIKKLLKYEVTIASASLGIFEAILYFAGAGLSFVQS